MLILAEHGSIVAVSKHVNLQNRLIEENFGVYIALELVLLAALFYHK